VDHERIARFVTKSITQQMWVVSYDNVEPVRDLYAEAPSITYDISYSARHARQGSEIMFFADDLYVPSLGGAMIPTESEASLFA
jgi:DNA adenine methylase